MKCKVCGKTAEVALKSHNAAFCRDCYLTFFRRQLQRGIESRKLFDSDARILVALSGGKDSLALMLELSEMGYDATGLFVDLAIPKSSDRARERVEKFCRLHDLELRVVDLAQEGLPLPEVKKRLRRPICSICGKIKRHFFNREAVRGKFDVLATGHNLDDETARLFSNVLRWDMNYLADQGPFLPAREGFASKVKPLWRLTEFETANYAFLRGIEIHKEPCPYSAGASFSSLKALLGKMERTMPGRKLDFYLGFLARGNAACRSMREEVLEDPGRCRECGAPAYGDLCGVCRIREELQQGNQGSSTMKL